MKINLNVLLAFQIICGFIVVSCEKENAQNSNQNQSNVTPPVVTTQIPNTPNQCTSITGQPLSGDSCNPISDDAYCSGRERIGAASGVLFYNNFVYIPMADTHRGIVFCTLDSNNKKILSNCSLTAQSLKTFQGQMVKLDKSILMANTCHNSLTSCDVNESNGSSQTVPLSKIPWQCLLKREEFNLRILPSIVPNF